VLGRTQFALSGVLKLSQSILALLYYAICNIAISSLRSNWFSFFTSNPVIVCIPKVVIFQGHVNIMALCTVQ